MKLPVNYDELEPHERRKVREAYIKKQGGVCHCCKEPLLGPPSESVQDVYINKGLFPNGFFKWPVHLHHSHDTGMTIGAVHARCNAVLWQYYGE